MADEQTHSIDEAQVSALAWLAAGLATGVVLAVAALDQKAASQRSGVRTAAARVAPAFVAVSSALH